MPVSPPSRSRPHAAAVTHVTSISNRTLLIFTVVDFFLFSQIELIANAKDSVRHCSVCDTSVYTQLGCVIIENYSAYIYIYAARHQNNNNTNKSCLKWGIQRNISAPTDVHPHGFFPYHFSHSHFIYHPTGLICIVMIRLYACRIAV